MGKTYTLTVTIAEGNDEFWEDLQDKSGADEVAEAVREALANVGFTEPDCTVRLTKFEASDA